MEKRPKRKSKKKYFVFLTFGYLFAFDLRVFHYMEIDKKLISIFCCLFVSDGHFNDAVT